MKEKIKQMSIYLLLLIHSFILAIHSLRVWTIKANKPKQSKNPLEMDKNPFELLSVPLPSPSSDQSQILCKMRTHTHTDTPTHIHKHL